MAVALPLVGALPVAVALPLAGAVVVLGLARLGTDLGRGVGVRAVVEREGRGVPNLPVGRIVRVTQRLENAQLKHVVAVVGATHLVVALVALIGAVPCQRHQPLEAALVDDGGVVHEVWMNPRPLRPVRVGPVDVEVQSRDGVLGLESDDWHVIALHRVLPPRFGDVEPTVIPHVREDRGGQCLQRLVITREPCKRHDQVLRGAAQGDPASVDGTIHTEVLADRRGEGGAPASRDRDAVARELHVGIQRVEAGVGRVTPGSDAMLHANGVCLRGRAVVGHRDGGGHWAVLALPERNLARIDAGGGGDGLWDVDHARTLTVHRLKVAGPGDQAPVVRIGGVAQRASHLERVEARLGLQQQCDGARHVRGSHRCAALGGVTAFLQRVGAVDGAARRGDVRLQGEVCGQAEGAEVGLVAAGGVVEATGLLRDLDGERTGLADLGEQCLPIGLQQRGHRDGDLGVALDGGVDDAGRVVEDEQGVVTRLLGGECLLVEGAVAALHQQRLALIRRGCRGLGGAPQDGVGCHDVVGGTGFEARGSRRAHVGHLEPARGGDVVGHVLGVVHRTDGDHVVRHGGSPSGEGARDAGVALRDHDGHAVVLHDAVGCHRGGVAGPRDERGAEAHVDDIHPVGDGPVHGGHDDVGRAAAVAAEDPVGAERDVRGHPLDLPVGADDAGHVRAVSATVVGEGVGPGGVGRGIGTAGVVGVAHEVVAIGHARVREVTGFVVDAGSAEVGMVVVDAGVDDAHLDALAGDAQFLVGDICTGQLLCVLDGGGGVTLDGLGELHDRIDALDAAHLRQGSGLVAVQLDADPVPCTTEGVADLHVEALGAGVGDQLIGAGALQFYEPAVLEHGVAVVGELLFDAGGGGGQAEVGRVTQMGVVHLVGASGQRRAGQQRSSRDAHADCTQPPWLVGVRVHGGAPRVSPASGPSLAGTGWPFNPMRGSPLSGFLNLSQLG